MIKENCGVKYWHGMCRKGETGDEKVYFNLPEFNIHVWSCRLLEYRK